MKHLVRQTVRGQPVAGEDVDAGALRRRGGVESTEAAHKSARTAQLGHDFREGVVEGRAADYYRDAREDSQIEMLTDGEGVHCSLAPGGPMRRRAGERGLAGADVDGKGAVSRSVGGRRSVDGGW